LRIAFDNAKSITETAGQLQEFLRRNIALLSTGKLGERIDELHKYAADKPSDLYTAFQIDGADCDLKISGFAAFLSTGITTNIRHLEETIGVKISDFANPSCRQGLGVMSSDPDAAKFLTRIYAARIEKMLTDYLHRLNLSLRMINRGDHKAVLDHSWQVYHRGAFVENAFSQQSADNVRQLALPMSPTHMLQTGTARANPSPGN
jgi:hypothetical protein